jgi:hypothetical protein
MNAQVLASGPSWSARPLSLKDGTAPLSPVAVDRDWQALGQSWRSDGVEAGYHPGWARVRWSEAGLCYEVILLGSKPCNAARALNENTWELGEVCEVFIQSPGNSRYLEIHVTPENQRLQLDWAKDDHAQWRRGKRLLQSMMVPAPDWVTSTTVVCPGYWFARVWLPAARLGVERLSAGSRFTTAVCRYDCSQAGAPVVSSTAPLTLPDFHRVQEWHGLTLVET